MSVAGPGPMVRGAPSRTVRHRVLPRGLHPAGADRRNRLSESKGALWPAVPGRRGDLAYDRRRSPTPRGRDRLFRRAAYLGPDLALPSASPLCREWRRPFYGRHPMDWLPSGLLLARTSALAAVSPAVPARIGPSL